MAYSDLTQTVTDAFNTLADEVQVLTDRKTVLEHKLRFAHEQFQYLADKYAPSSPEIAETLARLQLPPHTSLDTASPVPLPKRSSLHSQHQLALIIRDGRRAANKLASLRESSKTTASTRDTSTRMSHVDSMSTALEQDFTVEGKKGNLQCPFSKGIAAENRPGSQPENDHEPIPHDDPICAAMAEDSASQAGVNGAQSSKCPIRFIDQHSPEEIAHYVETHKHELPRSHELCLRRYQRNEEEVRKLDNKYGNIVSMIEDLSQLHKPMLPDENQRRPSDVSRTSNDRVENWAHGVSGGSNPEALSEAPVNDDDRQSHFDRPLKEVRVGESPSRPWGISVPVFEPTAHGAEYPISPPPAPVRMPSPLQRPQTPVKEKTGRCPFGFDNPSVSAAANVSPKQEQKPLPPFHISEPFTPAKDASQPPPQPTFINPDPMAKGVLGNPQMVFTGPVFIGYPMEQAIQFMNQYHQSQ